MFGTPQTSTTLPPSSLPKTTVFSYTRELPSQKLLSYRGQRLRWGSWHSPRISWRTSSLPSHLQWVVETLHNPGHTVLPPGVPFLSRDGWGRLTETGLCTTYVFLVPTGCPPSSPLLPLYGYTVGYSGLVGFPRSSPVFCFTHRLWYDTTFLNRSLRVLGFYGKTFSNSNPVWDSNPHSLSRSVTAQLKLSRERDGLYPTQHRGVLSIWP